MTHPTKLTLRLDSALIGQAKDYALRQDRSLSQIVGDYFARLTAEPDKAKLRVLKVAGKDSELSPVTRSLRGALVNKAMPGQPRLKSSAKPASKIAAKIATAVDPDKAAYHKYLEEKYL